MQNAIRFSKNDPEQFFQTLRGRVNAYFKVNDIPKTGDGRLYLKTAIVLSLFFLPLALILSTLLGDLAIFLCYAVMGVGMASIGFCVLHDAIHGSFSPNKKLNKLMGFSMNAIGGSAFTWTIQHNVLHHTYTNIYPVDEDVDDKPFLRLSPTGKHKSYHRFQHLYAPFIYALATLSWVFIKDFKQLAVYNKTGLTTRFGFKPQTEFWGMLLSKIAYLAVVLALPIILGATWWVVVLGFVLMHMIGGLYLTMVFQLAHVVEGPEQHHAPTDGMIENSWAVHQLSTTANFANQSKVATWLMGGLNFQIEHHLFPGISHVHYPRISEIVKSTAEEFGMPYHEYKRFGQAFRSHFRQLKSLGSVSA